MGLARTTRSEHRHRRASGLYQAETAASRQEFAVVEARRAAAGITHRTADRFLISSPCAGMPRASCATHRPPAHASMMMIFLPFRLITEVGRFSRLRHRA